MRSYQGYPEDTAMCVCLIMSSKEQGGGFILVEEWGEGVGNKGSQLSSVCSSPYISGLVVRGAAILWWVGNFVGEVIGVAW